MRPRPAAPPGAWAGLAAEPAEAGVRLGQVGPARIKVLRMDEQTYEEETHDYNEGLLVISGYLHLRIGDQAIRVDAGQMYLVEAGTAHGVLAGSQGTLVIIDL